MLKALKMLLIILLAGICCAFLSAQATSESEIIRNVSVVMQNN